MISSERANEIYAEIRDEEPFRGYDRETLIGILLRSPNFVQKTRDEWARNKREWDEYQLHIGPIISDLQAEGVSAASASFPLTSNSKIEYQKALPILVQWLPSVTDLRTLEWVGRSLIDPLAKPALPALLTKFESMRDENRSEARWALGMAIGRVMDSTVTDSVIDLISDSAFGLDRDGLIEQVWRLKDDDRTFELLVDLLDDPNLPTLVVIRGMRVQAHPHSRIYFNQFLRSDDGSIRSEARKGLAKLDKREAKAAGRLSPTGTPKKASTVPRQPPGEWPKGLPHDALVFLIMNDLFEPETLSGRSANDLLAVKGIGPKAIERIQLELKRRNLPPLSK